MGIVGCGGVALGYAAFLLKGGHQAIVWSPSGASARSLVDQDLTVSGTLEGSFRIRVAQSPEELVSDAEVVIIAVPGYGHRSVMDAVIPFARGGQSFIVSAQLSLSGVYLQRHLTARGIQADVLAWATTVLMGRRTGSSSVAIGGIRSMLEIAALPAEAGERCLNLCRVLFGDRFRLVPDIFAIALGNLNPPIHLASALCNFTRIEKGEYWANYDGITPSVARLIEALDQERLELAKAYRVKVRTVQEHYCLSFGFDEGCSIAEMAAMVHTKRQGPPGPTSLSTRFVTEDVPFGIVPLVELAHLMHETTGKGWRM
ncbi:NAD/NADP octopine/nopaline dehydrogenase family protein [Microvirga sp. VF16]|uniref:NAD/NADP octopine/nopaline dehydrogenase family protein n=1 Tax=Microvirga sp. VF16 TaxID=2807101 RepID=UPI00193E4FD7|nr:NAD/NADP octopine/nopaline dehydrogenase family protein [Microvirga sp. VF16]QRM35150.1 NAD/NADP octopine/nopaline dehydrogenase family protein [Microvirga sp. VF16]